MVLMHRLVRSCSVSGIDISGERKKIAEAKQRDGKIRNAIESSTSFDLSHDHFVLRTALNIFSVGE